MRLVIADDDQLFQSTVASILNRYPKDYEIAAQIYDGETAAAKTEELRPDVLLLDMEMPGLSGVEVARRVSALPHPPAILVLSNYDSFEYVRPVLKMGAEDYLLKHELSPDVLLQKLGEIRRRLIRERRLSSQKGKIDLLTRRSLLRELVLHANAPAVADAALLSRNAQSAGAVCTVVCMQLVNFLILYQADRGSPNREKITGTVMDLCTSIFSNLGSGLIAHIEHGEFCILFTFPREISAEKVRRETDRYMGMLERNLQKLLGVSMVYAAVPFHGGADCVRRSYETARSRLGGRPISGEPEAVPALDEERRLINLLYRSDAAGVREQLLRILDGEREDGGELEALCSRLIETLRRYLRTEAGPAAEQQLSRQVGELFRERLIAGELRRRVLDCYAAAMEQSAAGSAGSGPASIQNAVAYIRAHYRENLSLSQAAQSCGISEVYLSKRFKSEMNVSFVSYVNNLRIDDARELLRDPALSLREIADRTGFHNYNYFIKVFKDVTGVTPMYFRTHLPEEK